MPHIKKRGNIYYVYWYEKGKHHSRAISPIESDAIQWSAKKTLQIYSQKNGLQIRGYSFFEFIEEYKKEYVAFKMPRTQKRDHTTIQTFLKICPEIQHIDDFNELALKKYKIRRKDKEESTINRELGTLKHMQKIAFEKGYILEDVSKKTKFLDDDDNKINYVPSNEEIKLFFSVIEEPIKNAVILGIAQGMRSGEATHIGPEDFDFNSDLVKVRPKEGWEPKNKSSVRDMPIHPDFKEYYKRRCEFAKKIKSKYICCYEDGRKLTEDVLASMIYKIKNKILKGKINPEFSFHSLRHKFITMAGDTSIPMIHIANMVGHTSTKLTEQIYYHSTNEQNLKSISKISIPIKAPKRH